jgi:hypothetical protein
MRCLRLCIFIDLNINRLQLQVTCLKVNNAADRVPQCIQGLSFVKYKELYNIRRESNGKSHLSLYKLSYYLLPMLSTVFLPSPAYYRMIHRGRRLKTSPTNST